MTKEIAMKMDWLKTKRWAAYKAKQEILVKNRRHEERVWWQNFIQGLEIFLKIN